MAWQRFALDRSSKIIEVLIDPDRKIALADPTENAVRFTPEDTGDPSLRAAARIGTEPTWGLGCLAGGLRCGVAWNTLFLALRDGSDAAATAAKLRNLSQEPS